MQHDNRFREYVQNLMHYDFRHPTHWTNTNLVPIMDVKNNMRVPTWVYTRKGELDAGYTVCVGPSRYRHYVQDDAPKELVAVVAMIKAFPEEVRMSKASYSTFAQDAYSPPHESLAEIGWQLGDNSYMAILSGETFNEIAKGSDE